MHFTEMLGKVQLASKHCLAQSALVILLRHVRVDYVLFAGFVILESGRTFYAPCPALGAIQLLQKVPKPHWKFHSLDEGALTNFP